MQKKPDSSIFYSLAYINLQREHAIDDPDWGTLISPHQASDTSLPNSKMLDLEQYRHMHPLFHTILNKIHEDNAANLCCSLKYYADCFNLINQQLGNFQKIVEVGPQSGDLACLFAGIIQNTDKTLDIVDINKTTLLRTYEKINILFPEATPKIRLFVGDMPLYIKNIASVSSSQNIIHYQASHNFNDVIRDLGSTYFCKNKIIGTLVNHTHLRTTDIRHYAFVDVALYALFGAGIKFIKLGEEITDETSLNELTNPPSYFSSNRVDGLYIPYAMNHFRYPHPNSSIETYLYTKAEPVAQVES